MKKFEYKHVVDISETKANKLGNEGWELVQVIVRMPGWLTDGKSVAIFKREKAL